MNLKSIHGESQSLYNTLKLFLILIRKEVKEYFFERLLANRLFIVHRRQNSIYILGKGFNLIVILFIKIILQDFTKDLNLNRFFAVKFNRLYHGQRPF